MTITQLEYIVAVDNFRHFAEAAEYCFVTQPTLSMQIIKLENELGVKIFDRSKHPVVPTDVGEQIIVQARKILNESQVISQIVADKKGVLQGELRLGIIPTLAPYLLPLFIQDFIKKYPQIKLIISDLTTGDIIDRLKTGRLDAGLLVTPLNDPGITEFHLFYEEMVAYVSKSSGAYRKTYVLPGDIDPNKLWLLEEGHCFRTQILNLCELRKSARMNNFEYEAGSIETLRRMVEVNNGVTVLPELATMDLNARQLSLVRHFRPPAPMREVSIVTHRDFVKKRLVDVLIQEILRCLPEKIRKNKSKRIIAINESSQ
jgi:LysR family hydrogen peroxide-inducible transcriptional activator